MRRIERDRLLARLQVRVELEDRLRRALAASTTEDEAVRLVAGGLGAALSGQIEVVVDEDGDRCVAVRRTAPVLATSTQFDACAHLRERPETAAAVCAPVTAGSEVFGVVRWTGPIGRPIDEVEVATLAAVADMLGLHLVRLGHSEGDPRLHVDPLTGLLDRRSTGLAIRALVRDLVPFSLAVCDVDRFDEYNERHGHDVADRALRLLGQTLSSTLRPGDLLGRTAGDVFAVAFPSTSAIDAAHALERVREMLILSAATADVPPFTVSCGVTDSNQGDSIETIVDTAEMAVSLAKSSGANRVVVAGERTTQLPGSSDT